jgi:arylsulfatase A-like enzyme/putative intracellular protease/amidase
MTRPDVIIIMTDEERAIPPYESDDVLAWRREALSGRRWFDDHAVNFNRHYTGSLACVPSRPTIFTGQYPDVHGVTQTDGLGKMADDSRLRWLPEGEVPTLGNWFRAAGYDTHYDGKWHISHADLHHVGGADDGNRVETNDGEGNVDAAAVEQYRAANPLDAFGFDGWIGPEPHGGKLADSGVRRDPLIASRVVAWLEDRYARRAAGDADAQRPFLLVASFVNPHDIVLFPAWARRGNPLEPGPLDPPRVPEAPTAHEDLASKPAAQIAYRETYPSGYGPIPAVAGTYSKKAQEYRDLYYRLHAEVDGPIDRVRRAITGSVDQGGNDSIIVRTSDHGDLLGAHGGLHQKWFTLYDEATRVPFSIARVGASPTTGTSIDGAPTSHVDIVPTLLAAAGIDELIAANVLQSDFSEVHSLPGRNLMPVVDAPDTADAERPVYLMTRDNMLEGDSGASGLARRLGRTAKPPAPLRIQVPAHVASNFEGLVVRVSADVDGAGNLWKLVRTFDDPDTWTEPGVCHLAASGPGGDEYRTVALPDQWELYDLDADPIEAVNRWNDESVFAVFSHMETALQTERARAVPERNNPWPYASRQSTTGAPMKKAPPPARLLRKVLQRAGMHPDDPDATTFDLAGKRALIVATNTAVMEIGKPTGVFASEMTVPYYAFLDAGMAVDVGSPLGGVVPVDPQSIKPVIRCADDDRFLADDDFKAKVTKSLAIADLDMDDYDIVFLAGGWGAAFDFGFSDVLGEKMTEANAGGLVMGGVCHGPLGLLNAKSADGSPLVDGRKISAVTDKQVKELGIQSTPHHPERELRGVGAAFESQTRRRDPLANHWVVDGNIVTGQNQNAGPMVAREMMQLLVAQTSPSTTAPTEVAGTDENASTS